MRASEEIFRSLLSASPDAMVCVDREGLIVFLNKQTEELFGYEPDELLGRPVEHLIPESLRDKHVEHRAEFMANLRERAMGSVAGLVGRRKDGTEFPVDISLRVVQTDDGPLVAAFVRDITSRLRAEEDARALRDAEFRRRQALEINDTVVQGLATAMYSLEAGATKGALEAISHTLGAARVMMADLLTPPVGRQALEPGDLIRRFAADVVPALERPTAPPDRARDVNAIRVVIADDTPDIRLALRYTLSPGRGFEVVGEAANGEEAIKLSEMQQPDVILLDLAMPVMDGLQAIPEIRRRAPETKIVALSGYGADQMAAEAMDCGAHAYIEKGTAVGKLIAMLGDLCPDRAPRRREMPGVTPVEEETDATGSAEELVTAYLHELRAPLTVIQGVADTLRERIDVLPSSVVLEFIDSVRRNVRHLIGLLDAFSDARTFDSENLDLVREPTDVGVLVQETLDDLSDLTKGRRVAVKLTDGIEAMIDPVRVRQVLTNLVSNAVKFSPPGEPVELDMRVMEGFVVVSVTDHGPGIPEESRAKLFRKYARFGKGSGIGLGLYISRAIARAHGGNLILGRSEGSRTTFVLALPVSSPAKPAGEHRSASSP